MLSSTSTIGIQFRVSVTYEEALELEAAIAVDLGHIATAIDRYGNSLS